MKTKKRNQRIIWNSIETLSCANLISYGLHGKTIGFATGLSCGQVYYRAKALGMHLRDYRDGRGPVGTVLLRRFTVRRMTSKEARQMRNDLWPVVERRLQEHKK